MGKPDTNARIEFINFVERTGSKVLCASIYQEYNDHESIYQDDEDYDAPDNRYNLICNYTNEEYEKFLESLDFMYDSGYGGQNLFGTIWFEDCTWADRGEYDGSEWWQLHIMPTIPEILMRAREHKGIRWITINDD